MTCGQVMAAKAAMPAKLAEMLTAINDNTAMHAKWAGTKDKAAKGEHDAMMKVVKDHKAMIAAANKTSKDMAAMKDMPPCKHDMKTMDPKMMDGMTKALALQKEFAAMLIKDAEMSEKMMADMQAKMGAKPAAN